MSVRLESDGKPDEVERLSRRSRRSRRSTNASDARSRQRLATGWPGFRHDLPPNQLIWARTSW